MAPPVVAAAFVVFPVLERHNLGYSTFHISCELGFCLAMIGIAAWIVERVTLVRSSSWISFIVFAGYAVGAVWLRFMGDWYWAFERGYFLN